MSSRGETSTIVTTRSLCTTDQDNTIKIPRITRSTSKRIIVPSPETTPVDDSSVEEPQEANSADMNLDEPVVVPTIIRLPFGTTNNFSATQSQPEGKRKRGRPRKNTNIDASSLKRIRLNLKGKAKKIEKIPPQTVTDKIQTPESNDEMQQIETQQDVISDETQSLENNDISTQEHEILDEKGEQKITKDGELLGGRKYKVPVFQLPTRGETWYMCSMDPSKVLGFRDSYTFFTKNPSLKRIPATNEERDYIITTGFIPTNLRNRPITLVTARSIFKLFGSKIIQGGKKRQDDYYESRFETESSDKDKDSETENTNNILPKRMSNNHMLINKSINNNDPLSWMYRFSLSTQDFNTRLKLFRQDSIKFYDPHTNIEQVPRDIQPTRIRTEMISSARNNTIIEPEIKFETISRNSFGVLSPEVMNVLPTDVRNIIDVMNNEETTLHKENKYPIALVEGQFQVSYPLHNSRFQPSPSTKISKFTAPYFPAVSAVVNEDQYNYQNYNQNGKNSLQFSKANPQYICAVITATTGMPCRRAVTANGERCMYHRNTPRETYHTDEKTCINYEAGASNSVQQTVVTESCATTSEFKEQSLVIPSENACAQCLSATVPSTTILPNGVLPCSNDFTIKCSHCHRKFHPLCLTLSHSRLSRLLVAMESYHWQCNDCKTCVICQSSGDEATLLICDDCDRGWHLDCSSPKVTEVPRELWLCSLCARCDSCGEKATCLNNAANNYHHVKETEAVNYPIHLATICNKCQSNFTRDLFCPICLKIYSEDGQENDDDKYMVCCDVCDRWIHARCDETLTPERYQELADIPDAKYICPLCEARIRPLEEGNKVQQKALAGNPLAIPVARISGHPIRGIISYKGKNVAVPEIPGWEKN